MAPLFSVFFDEPLSTFGRVSRVLGQPKSCLEPRNRRSGFPVLRTHFWTCGCRALICQRDRCCIALCEMHGERDGQWLRIESAS